MMLHFYNSENHKTYEEAKAAGAIFSCDAPLDEDQFDRWGWEGGILCDAMQAVYAALRCAGVKTVEAVLVDGDKVISCE